MTSREKLFFFILTLHFLVANTVPLEFSLVPKINCHDLNGNGTPDYIALSKSNLPRTIYHVELFSTKTEVLWQFHMPEGKKGYFVDMILDDFDNDDMIELIAIAYQDEGTEIFYIFSADTKGFYRDPPVITELNKAPFLITNPRKLYPMLEDDSGRSMFLLVQGSPNRKVIICELLDHNIINRGSVGEKFLNNTMAPINISLGDFNSDGSEDIFILDNGFVPSGYFIYSDGSEEELALPDYPRLQNLYEKGKDINFDGSDDLVMINRKGELMSDIWSTESIPLSDKKIQDIIINTDNGLIYITTINQTGKIGNYSVDPLTRSILSSNFELPKFTSDYSQVYALVTSQGIIITHDGDEPEIWTTSLAQELISNIPPLDYIQRIYYNKPDYVINVGEDFYHKIKWDDNADFRNFTEEHFPIGMVFDLDDIKLSWKPKQDQLGYHQLSYALDMRKKGSLEMDLDEGRKIISQTEHEIQENYSYLLYVNDPIKLKPSNNHLTIVNGELFEWVIPIEDSNADAKINVVKISGPENAEIYLIPPEVILIPMEISTIEPDSIVIDTAVVEPEIGIDSVTTTTFPDEPSYVDTVKTEFEKFTEQKLKSEPDPFRKNKLQSADEEFKKNEAEYREKLKTHKKILRAGENIWIPVDSLILPGDSIISEGLDITQEQYQEKFETHKKTLKDGKNIWLPKDSLAQPNDSIGLIEPEIILSDTSFEKEKRIDSLLTNNLKSDATVVLETNIEETVEDTNYVEIPYRELVAHQAHFLWQPKVEPGDYDFIISAFDGFTADTTIFTITVHPQIDISMNHTEYNATVDEIFTTQIVLEQMPWSQKFTYDLVNAPENMKIDTLGNINWVPIPTQVDDYNFDITVSDGIAADTLPMNIYVNAPPVISSRPTKIFFLPDGEKLNFPLESFDLNSNASLEWKLLSGPTDMALSSEGVLTWNNTNLGHHPYGIELTDGIDSVQWQADIYVNATPEITSNPVTVVTKGKRYEYALTAWDANKMSPFDSLSGNQISFSLIQGPEGLNIDENNLLNWDTQNVPLGEHMVAITASDGADDDIQVFPIFINSFPVIISSDSIIVHMGADLKFQMESTDKNLTDTLTYHLDPLLGNMVMELHSGLLTWTPEKKDLGVNTFRLQVKDGHDFNGTVMHFKIFVYDFPRITSDLSKEAFTDMEYTAFLTAEDMNGKKLDGPESIVIDSASFNYYNLSQYAHLFKWTPRDVDKGSHTLLIKLTDDFGFTAYHRHNFTVFSNPCIHCDKEETAPADTTGR